MQLPLKPSLTLAPSMSKSLYGVLLRRQRLLLTALLVCALTLGCLCWFTGFKRSSETKVIWSMVEFDDGIPASAHPTTVSESTTTKSQHRILLVSAFYPLTKSKHTDAEYTDWLWRFLGHVSTDIYFFTTPEMEPLVRRARDALPSKVSNDSKSTSSSHISLIINTTFSSPFSIPPLLPYRDKYEQMHTWDREKDRHSPELYAMWNAKPWFLREGLQNMRMQGFDEEYDYAFWTDAGSFRHDHAYDAWPDVARVEEVWEAGFQLQIEQWKALDAVRDGMRGDYAEWDAIREKEKERKAEVTSKEDLVFLPIYQLPGKAELGWKESLGPIDIDFSEGTFFGTSSRTISWYTDLFYAYHDHYISTPPPAATAAPHPHASVASNTTLSGTPPFHFVGKDQTIINALLFLYPHRFISVVSPSLLPSSPSISTSPQVEKWTWNLKSLTTTASNKLWEKFRGKQGGVCGDEWFYYQYFVAGAGERRVMRRVWNAGLGWAEALLRGSGKGEKGEGKTNKEGENDQGCPLVQVVTIEGVLRGLFGVQWEVPRGIVSVVQ